MSLPVLSRAFTSNLGAITVNPKEQSELAAQGISEPIVQRYVLWRRATILMVVIATVLSAGVSTYSTFTDEDQPNVLETLTDSFLQQIESAVPGASKFTKPSEETATPADAKAETDAKAEKDEKTEKTAPADAKAEKDDKDDKSEKAAPDEEEVETKAMGRLADGAQLISLYILPIAAAIVIFLGNRFRLSYRIMVGTFLVSFFAPMLLAICPWSWWGYPEPKVSPTSNPLAYARDQAEGIMEGAAILAGLLPSVLSLIPGVQRACLRVKTLLPQSLLPGWLIVVASPIYGLFLLVVVVAVDQMTGEPAILLSLALLAASSLVYLIRADAFTRPLLVAEDYKRMKRVQTVVGLMTALAGGTLVTYLATREVMGIHLVGFDASKSLMRPIEIVELLLETIGRSMFVSALGADLIMRMSLNAWRQGNAVAASETATSYDGAMKGLEGVV